MRILSFRTVYIASLAAIGFVLGALGVSIATGTVLKGTPLSKLLGESDTASTLAASSCVPSQDGEDVYFVSCGGVL